MRHNLLLIGAETPTNLLKELKRTGCSVHATTDVHQARQALRKQPVDLVYIHVPQQAASLRLATWVAKAGVPALVIALPDAADRMDVTKLRPAVLRFVCRAASPGVVRRVIVSALEDLATCRELKLAKAAAHAWPIAVVSSAGQVLFASPEGSKAVTAVSAPAAPKPVRRLDTQLIHRVQSAVKSRKHAGQVALFRRDGILSHFETHVRRFEGGCFGLLMLDARDLARTPPAPTVISLVGLLRRRR